MFTAAQIRTGRVWLAATHFLLPGFPFSAAISFFTSLIITANSPRIFPGFCVNIVSRALAVGVSGGVSSLPGTVLDLIHTAGAGFAVLAFIWLEVGWLNRHLLLWRSIFTAACFWLNLLRFIGSSDKEINYITSQLQCSWMRYLNRLAPPNIQPICGKIPSSEEEGISFAEKFGFSQTF